MRLNGIHAEPGTIIGYHQREKRFLAVDSNDEKGVVLRFATAEELNSVGYLKGVEPRSYMEFRAISRERGPFGMVRQWRKPEWKGFLNRPAVIKPWPFKRDR